MIHFHTEQKCINRKHNIIYASRQWFLLLCVIGLSLKLEKCWVRIKSSRRMGYVIWLHKRKSIRRQRCCWAIPSLLLYIQTRVPVPKAHDAEGQAQCLSISPSHAVSAREKWQVTSKTEILPENRYWLCSQMKSSTSTEVELTGWVCAPKSETPNSYNHTILRPISNQ